MSQTLQDITFGFFETLPEDTRFQVNDILYGERAVIARPVLPWSDEKTEPSVACSRVSDITPTSPASVEVQGPTPEGPKTEVAQEPALETQTEPTRPEAIHSEPTRTEPTLEHTHSGQTHQEPARPEHVAQPTNSEPALPMFVPPDTSVPPPGMVPATEPMALPHMNLAPPGTIYAPHPGMPVLPGMPLPPPYLMYPPGMMPMGVPLSYMAAAPMGAPVHHSIQDMGTGTRMLTEQLEANKILGGKTYERRNKKRRPPDYYQKLEATKHMAPSPITYLSQSAAAMYAPPPPPPNSILHYHPPSPSHMAQQLLNHHAMMDTRVAPPPAFIPPGAPVHGPPPPQYLPGAPTANLSPRLPPTQNTPKSPPRAEPTQPPPTQPPPTQPQVEDSSLASELYTDNSRTVSDSKVVEFSFGDVEDVANISFGEVDSDLTSCKEDMFPWESKNNNNVMKKASQISEKSPPRATTDAQRQVTDTHSGASTVEKKENQLSTNPADPALNQSVPTMDQPQNVSPSQAQSANSTQTLVNSSQAPPAQVPFTSDQAPSVNAGQEPSHSAQVPVTSTQAPVNSVETPTSASQAPVNSVQTPASSVQAPVNSVQAPVNSVQTTDSSVQAPVNSVQTPTSSVQAPANAAPAKSTSWAGLFRGTPSANTATVIYGAPSTESATKDNAVTKPEDNAGMMPGPATPKTSQKLGALVRDHSLSYKAPSLQPRGLINRGNWCYVNATLQALLACPPFYNLLKQLPASPHLGPTTTPILDSIVEFINEFSEMPEMKPIEKNNKGAGPKGNIKYDVPSGPVFEVTYVYKMLQQIKYDGFKSGRQEDAEEFLSCVINGLHDEMVAAAKALGEQHNNNKLNGSAEVTTNGDTSVSEDGGPEDEEEAATEDGWEQVGPKNKSVVTRATSFDSSPISDIFRGQFRNTLNRQGCKESATLQPFYTLQLDIQSDKVLTVQDALENLVSKETLQGFTCSKTNQEVDASRRTMLEDLPPVLILHLKCFVYDKNGGCQKVVKKVDFSNELEISKELLSPQVRIRYPMVQRKYKLFAVVKHIGVRAAGGHYTTDVYYPSLGEWLHLDDNHVHTVSMPQVFKFRSPRIPYLLYYRRADLN